MYTYIYIPKLSYVILTYLPPKFSGDPQLHQLHQLHQGTATTRTQAQLAQTPRAKAEDLALLEGWQKLKGQKLIWCQVLKD